MPDGPWVAHMVRRRQVWHAIITLGPHTRSNYIGHVMPSLPLGSTHSWTTLSVTYHNRHWTTNITRQCRVWHAIIALEQDTHSDNIGCGIPLSHFNSIHGRTTLGVACYRLPCITYTIETTSGMEWLHDPLAVHMVG